MLICLIKAVLATKGSMAYLEVDLAQGSNVTTTRGTILITATISTTAVFEESTAATTVSTSTAVSTTTVVGRCCLNGYIYRNVQRRRVGSGVVFEM